MPLTSLQMMYGILFAVVVVCSLIFVLLLGQSTVFKDTPVAALHTLLVARFPTAVVSGVKAVLGERGVKVVQNAYVYCFESRNPLLQIFFLVIVTGSLYGFFTVSFKDIPGPYLSAYHIPFIYLHCIAIYASFYVASVTKAGVVTRANVDKLLELYKYDHLLFSPKECSTCKLPKPARSKHCSACNACIVRADHHCGWINGCVGARNHRWFLLFLLMMIQFCTYGTYICFQIMRGKIITYGLDHAYKVDKITGHRQSLGFYSAMVLVLQIDRITGALAILAALIALVVSVFTAYQLYLVARGVTTNEAFKWEDVEESICRGELWVTEEDALPNKNESTAERKRSKGLRGGVSTSPDSSKSSARMRPVSHRQGSEREGTAVSEQSQGRERRVASLKEVDNRYDRGLWHNLMEVVFSPSF